MKNINIITGSDLRFVMGVNNYIKSFIQCNDYFKAIYLNRVFSCMQTLNIDKGDQMPIGNDIGTYEYKIRRGVRRFLRKLLTDKFYPFALLRYSINEYIVSRGSLKRFMADNSPCDYIIFQELSCAEYYFKHYANSEKTKYVKTALVVHSEDDSGSMLIDKFIGFGRKDMKRRFLRKRDYVYSCIDKVIYISNKAYNNSILPENKKALVYNGSPDIENAFLENDYKRIEFVCVGSMDGRKGQDIILKAMSLMNKEYLNKLHMTFVGDGAKMDYFKQLTRIYKLDNYVTFMGRRNDVSDILRTKDVFIMPSKIEGLPMSAIEAMRSGLYLILTDTGGNAELCQGGCGTLCSRTPEDVLSKIYQVFINNIISLEQKNNSRKRFKNYFSLEKMAIGYESILISM